MKRFLSFIAVSVLFVACSKEANQPEKPVSAGRISISPTITKVTETSFEQGDEIGLTIARKSGIWADNAKLSYAGGLFSGELDWYPDSDASTLKAYYPYSATFPTTFTVALDQRSGVSSSDFVAAVKTGVVPSKEAIQMTFSHKLSNVLITLENRSGNSIDGVTIGGMIPTATVSENFEIGVADVQPEEIQTLKVSDTKYRLIVVPQTAAITVKVTAGDKVMTQELASSDFASGMEYNMGIVVLEDSIRIVLSSDINPWDDGGDIPTDPITSKGAYKHVVIIGVDGAGAFFKDTPTPRIDEIFAGQATTLRSKTSFPTISAQCWTSLLHGVLPEYHRITNDIAEDKTMWYPVKSPYPSIFRVARETYPDAKLASFVSWYAINNGIIEHNLGIEMGETKDVDPEIARMAVKYLSENDPMLLFVHFGSPDVIGEKEGFGTPAQLQAITDLDTYIGWIYDQLKLKDILDETLFIVTADHGGKGKSHGGDSDEERYVFLGIAGKSVADGTIEDAETRDVAAIAAYALGLECPDTWTGHVPAGVFKDVTEVGERKEGVFPGAQYRNHATVQTPALSDMQSLLNGHQVMAYFPFDNNITDAFGNVQTTSSGTLQYNDGYFGTAVALHKGYVTLKDFKVGTESFSAAFWLKATQPSPTSADPGIISNKNWQEGVYKGFILSLRGSGDIKFNVGDGSKNRMDFTRILPGDFADGWMHVIMSVDRPNKVVRIWYDFIDGDEAPIPNALASISFDSLNFNIGQDGTGSLSYKLPAWIDDLVITKDVLDDDDVKALRNYYLK